MNINNTHNRKGGYSIIAAVLMIGFLLILTTSTLNLVLQEMQDGKGRQDYMKAYAGAEWALELALFEIKKNWYWYDDDSFQNSNVLWIWNKIPKLSYEFDSKVRSHSWSISAYWTDIIPLFWINNLGTTGYISDIEFTDVSSQLIWNIVTEDTWGSWIWSFDESDFIWEKKLNETTGELEYSTLNNIGSVINGENYLIIYNPTGGDISYSLTSNNDFTRPRAIISSRAQVWKYTQNLETLVDNTKFLGILKYSIYSWN